MNQNTTPDAGNTAYPTQPIVGGTTYKIKYRGVNIHGAGFWSGDVAVIASTKPEPPPAAWTTLTNATVTINWNPSTNDHKQAVKKYRVKFRQSNGVFTEDTTMCDGANSVIFNNLKCSVAMTKFTSTPFNLAINDLIVV